MGKRWPSIITAIGRAALGASLFAWLVGTAMPARGAPSTALDINTHILNPPNAITDLVASPVGAQAGDVQLVWTAPANLNRVRMNHYLIRFATYPASSQALADAWWSTLPSSERNATATAAAGVTEFTTVTGLTTNVTYYFGIKAIDDDGQISPIDTRTGTAIQAHSVPVSSATVRPAAPAGLKGFLDASQQAFAITWEPVTRKTDGTTLTNLAGYNVYRHLTLTSSGTLVTPIPLTIAAFADVVNGRVYYYTVRAVDTSGVESADSLIADSSIDANIIYLDPDGITQVVMPQDVNDLLRSAYNKYGVPMTIQLTENPVAANTGVVRNVRFKIVRTDNGQEVKDLTFSQPTSLVAVGYNVVGGEVAFGAPAVNGGGKPRINGVTPDQLSLYWFNGVEWVHVGGTVDQLAQAVKTKSSFLGDFQLRVRGNPSTLSLEKGNVYPRLFTPNGDGLNDRVYIVLINPNNAAVSGEIFDKDGRHVRSLPPPQVTVGIGTTLIWDGKDDHGDVVPSGAYIYKVSGEGRTITGTVGVAR